MTLDQKALSDTKQGTCAPFIFSKAVGLFRVMDMATCISYRYSYYTLLRETEIDQASDTGQVGTRIDVRIELILAQEPIYAFCGQKYSHSTHALLRSYWLFLETSLLLFFSFRAVRICIIIQSWLSVYQGYQGSLYTTSSPAVPYENARLTLLSDWLSDFIR